ncbi:hypothetical protein D3C87_1395420 [compost metagenome]
MAQTFKIVWEGSLNAIGEIAVCQSIQPFVKRTHDHLQRAGLGLSFREMCAACRFGFLARAGRGRFHFPLQNEFFAETAKRARHAADLVLAVLIADLGIETACRHFAGQPGQLLQRCEQAPCKKGGCRAHRCQNAKADDG